MHDPEDHVAPLDRIRRFRDRMTTEGDHCPLVEYPGADHGFFDLSTDGRYGTTVEEAVGFLLDDTPPTGAHAARI
ncbi:hypothetical protein ACFVYE_30790 [Streptomyces sp. NPDC058239]|uniref:hypothetical protein n=1 Tax=unclassified Streptomyces TaxID=2593676 RepID=UPI00364A198E